MQLIVLRLNFDALANKRSANTQMVWQVRVWPREREDERAKEKKLTRVQTNRSDKQTSGRAARRSKWVSECGSKRAKKNNLPKLDWRWKAFRVNNNTRAICFVFGRKSQIRFNKCSFFFRTPVCSYLRVKPSSRQNNSGRTQNKIKIKNNTKYMESNQSRWCAHASSRTVSIRSQK